MNFLAVSGRKSGGACPPRQDLNDLDGNALFRDIPHGSGKEDAAVRAVYREEEGAVEGQ